MDRHQSTLAEQVLDRGSFDNEGIFSQRHYFSVGVPKVDATVSFIYDSIVKQSDQRGNHGSNAKTMIDENDNQASNDKTILDEDNNHGSNAKNILGEDGNHGSNSKTTMDVLKGNNGSWGRKRRQPWAWRCGGVYVDPHALLQLEQYK